MFNLIDVLERIERKILLPNGYGVCPIEWRWSDDGIVWVDWERHKLRQANPASRILSSPDFHGRTLAGHRRPCRLQRVDARRRAHAGVAGRVGVFRDNAVGAGGQRDRRARGPASARAADRRRPNLRGGAAVDGVVQLHRGADRHEVLRHRPADGLARLVGRAAQAADRQSGGSLGLGYSDQKIMAQTGKNCAYEILPHDAPLNAWDGDRLVQHHVATQLGGS